jgi:hypothetical protein
MIIEERTANFAACEGKFFQVVERSEEGVETFRQLECYMPAAVSTYKEPLEATRSRFLAELERGARAKKWGLGATGKPLTARYRIRESDGQLMSVLALEGGLKR